MKKIIHVFLFIFLQLSPGMAFGAPATSVEIRQDAQKLKDALQKMPYAAQGQGPVLYVFGFSECPYCQQFYKDYRQGIPGVQARYMFYAVSQHSANETAALAQSRSVDDYHAFMNKQKVAQAADQSDASIDAFNAIQGPINEVILPVLKRNGWRSQSLVSPTFIWEENGKLYVDGGYRKDHFETILASVKIGGSTVSAAAASKVGSSASASTSKPLIWRDLIGHPERWPAQTTMTIGITVDGENLNAGLKMPIYNVTAQGVELVAPRGYTITLAPDETTLLNDANAVWASLTAEQQALTLPVIARDRSLWPAQVKILEPVSFGRIKINAGAVLPLVEVRGNEVAVVDPRSPDMLFFDARYCDLFSRSRELAAIPADSRPGMMKNILAGIPVDASGKPAKLNDARYYVFYFASSTCPRCEIFTPKLVEYYNKFLASRNDVALITWPTEASTSPMLGYMKSKGMAWPTIPVEIKGRVEMLINGKGVFEIPGFLVLDKYTNLLLSTSKMPGQPLDVAASALAQLEGILKKK